MIELKNVEKIYQDGTRAVKGISFEVYEGELTILVGPSGCGKTTTMKMINRLHELSGGEIMIRGQNIMEADPIELRRNIGYVIQEIGLFPHMTIAENIATVPQLKRWDKGRIRKRVTELLELMGLDPEQYQDRYPCELSGGQRQRIGVARALASDPPILLMDEPFGALDPINRERLQDEFLRLQEQLKKTIVFVTHDIDEAVKIGNRIAVMKDGELIQYATPRELLKNPRNTFVRNFVGSERTLKRMSLLKVREAMRENPRTISADESLERVREIMAEGDIRYLMVVDRDKNLEGWILAADLQKGNGSSLEDYLDQDITTIEPEATLKTALTRMLRFDVGNLPVISETNKLIGILTFNDLQRILGETYTEKGGAGDGVV